MTYSHEALDGLERLVDEFTSRCRNGQSPSVSEYLARYPEQAAHIEELLPMVAAMEQLRAGERSKREALARRTALAHPPQRIGDFQIVREIGRGGMGIVYEAQQRSLSRPVAVKVLPKHALLLEKHLQRFRREARTAARLHHTNIVPVFGVGEQDGLHYYVMPLVRGVGLDEIIRELRAHAMTGGNGRCPPDIVGLVRKLTARKLAGGWGREQEGRDGAEPTQSGTGARGAAGSRWQLVARLGVQAAEALDYAHQQGTLHRDIKPGNLLLDEEGVIYVADFGLARAMDGSDVSRSGDFVGTARYMAPEQSQGTADARSDIYALGLTLYELLTLRPALDPAARGGEHGAGRSCPEPVCPSKIDRSIPRDLETIVLKCLALEPSKRYQTAAALGSDLRRFLEDRPILARRASAAERAVRWCRRNPALAAVSGLAAVLLIAFAVTALVGYAQTRKAYAATQQALRQTEATSQLSLEALDDVYARLSPGRVWIAWDSDPASQACACVGLAAGDSTASSVERTSLQVRASGETAMLLENLLVFYDRLAAQGGDDARVTLQSAVASRRVGDIRLCLGHIEQAEQGYLRAIEKLSALRGRLPASVPVATELAHNYNEVGNVRSARRDDAGACASHRAALSVLRSCPPSERPTAEYRYELARTFYFLARKASAVPGDARRRAGDPQTAWPSPPSRSNDYRRSAIRILEELSGENPRAPDYRLLLALCHRDMGGAPGLAGRSDSGHGRQRAMRILEELVAEYPSVADYRYELIATYAWVPIGLFPWQGHPAVSAEDEASLRKGLAESERLVAQCPSVPHYARSQALVLAKLAAVCWGSRRLAEAEGLLAKSVQTQNALVAQFPDLPPHDRVLLEFFRLRLAQVRLNRIADGHDRNALRDCRDSIESCAGNLAQLTKKPALAEDQLAWTSLPLAYDALGGVDARLGQNEDAQQALNRAKAARNHARGTSRTPPATGAP